MKEVVKTMFQCDHCGKWYHREHSARDHESGCHKNPDNFRKCLDGCVHLQKRKTTVYHDHPVLGEQQQTVELFHCAIVDSFLYPPKVERKENAFELGDDLNEPMKKECEFFKFFGTA